MKKDATKGWGISFNDKNLPPVVPEIDILKGIAIISVVLLHALPISFFLLIGSPYHIWHAIPLFILIAGFNGAYAYKRYRSITLSDCYNPTLLARRFSRLLIPFLICWCIELAILYSINQMPAGNYQLIIDLLKGGYSWGSYFVPVILQSVLIVPVLYLLALRNPNHMVIISLFLTLFFDGIALIIGLDPGITELIYFRYLFAGALGVWIVTSKKLDDWWVIAGGITSFIYITISCYTPLLTSIPGYSGYGSILQAPAFMWTVILALGGLKYLWKKQHGLLFIYLEKAGKASFHIFLVQLVYYMLPAAYVYAFLVTPVSFGSVILSNILIVVINIVICLPLGYLWYTLEKRYIRLGMT